MLQCNADYAVPTEFGFRRQQILTEVLRDEAAYHIGQACQNQNPCKKEMVRPVPNRGTDDHRNGKINEGRGCETAGFAPVQARVTYENAYAAHQQANDAEHDDPVRDTNKRDMARHWYRFDCCFNASFTNHNSPTRSFCHHRSKKEPQQGLVSGCVPELDLITCDFMKYTRRDFIKSSAALAVGFSAAAQTSSLETFSDWIKADRTARKRGLAQCLQRIRDLEPSIHAWVVVQPGQAAGEGPLAEIPFGVKDIVETKGMATEYGSPLYKGRVGNEDAAIIRELRSRGAVLLGKTVTTAFAYRTPGPTRNPRNLEHTPGGSSSGSAAAVAAGMVPFALGTQTRGSVLRPASYCGVTGFKMSYGLMSMEGVLPFAKSLDTLGFFTHTPADMLALWESVGHSTGRTEEFALGAPDPIPEVEPEMAAGFRNAVSW